MRPEYRREDLGDGVRGKYHEAYSKGVSSVVGGSKADVRVDSVRLMREIRDELYEETKDLSTEELIQFYRRSAAATKEKLSRLPKGEKK